MMKEGTIFVLAYLLFVPLAIYAAMVVSSELDISMMWLMGFALSFASATGYKYLPKKGKAKRAMGIASFAFWLFLLIDSYIRSGFDAVVFIMFILSSFVMYLMAIEKD